MLSNKKRFKGFGDNTSYINHSYKNNFSKRTPSNDSIRGSSELPLQTEEMSAKEICARNLWAFYR